MCGIIGIFHRENAESLVEEGLSLMKNRGRDGSNFLSSLHGCIGHSLHAMVDHVSQPLKGKGILTTNCEIYNWKEIYSNAQNDADALLFSLDHYGIEKTLELLDGDYAFAYWIDHHIFLARDLFGIKPLWYSRDSFAFASERKVLENLGYLDIQELNPRHYLVYDLEKKSWKLYQRKFVSFIPEHRDDYSLLKKQTKKLLLKAVEKRNPRRTVGILFSGGLDSFILVQCCKELKIPFHCYATIFKDAPGADFSFLEEAQERYNIPLTIRFVSLSEIEKVLPLLVPLIEDNNVVKVAVALTNYFSCEEAQKNSIKVIFSGLGADEIFGGYDRFLRATQLNSDCYSSLLKIYERDLYRDDVISMFHKIELRLPFLDKALADYVLKIPAFYKIQGERRKIILRDIGKELEIPLLFSERKKKSAQYGSGMDKALQILAKKNKFLQRSPYLKQFYNRSNLKLGVLFSGGKDSSLAALIMQEQGYELSCLVSILCKNPDSYLFHTPSIEMVKTQAACMEIPLVLEKSSGEKEKELEDLKRALEKAKKEHKIEGIVSGALFSEYQRQRIEEVCDNLSLKIFSPLWHMHQETVLRELLRRNFEVIINAIAAEGLDETWLGRKIDERSIMDLLKLEKKHHINIAGEGGEFESLVLDCPLFKKKITVDSFEKKTDTTSSGRICILSFSLHEK